jgi:DNA-binding SARP family transcriptional activator/Flp pilus assembly protein TadD
MGYGADWNAEGKPVAADTEFCILGPLAVRRDEQVVAIRPGKQRVVLAALLLSAGRVVPVDELAEALWGDSPPQSARPSLQNYVMRLRKTLADVGVSRITTEPGGYLISVEAGELDVERFESSLSAARGSRESGSWADAAAQLRAALSLWRGQPLSDVPSEVLKLREVPRLTEMRWQAHEARIDADLHLGHHAEVIAELRQLVATEPLRERLHVLLMTALYRDGQQAGALAAYQSARSTLIQELGAEPGPELRELQQQVLAGDPVQVALPYSDQNSDSASAGRSAGHQPGLEVPSPEVPRQLPAATAQFAGRADEMAALGVLIDRNAVGTVVISAIAGTAGVGKTALAVRFAHQMADRFPDGQLYLNLRGYDPGQPVSAADALAGFLRALGVPGQDISAEPDERAARYRSLLAGRRMLVLLDNASSVEQVRPLLPGTAGCVAIVTSRDSLVGLVARDGARRLDLDLLPQAESVGLLRALIGVRADADPAAVQALAGQCARLPLALRVAAELAVSRPGAPLADLVRELADQRQRLDLLEVGGDPRTAVRSVFSWSYLHLEVAAARAFRLLSQIPSLDVDYYGAAALTGSAAGQARRVLDQLARAHLIHAVGPDRYGMHDLLRIYARELAASEDSENERQDALTRLFDYYLHTAAAAMDTLFPAERDRRPRIASSATPAPEVATPGAAREWLDAQRAGLVVVAAYTAENGWPAHATRLAAVLFRYLETGGHYPEAITIHAVACRAASSIGDRPAEADALTSLGIMHLRQDRYQQAADQFQQALALYSGTGDRAGEARVVHNLGNVAWLRGRHQDAASYFQHALTLSREIGDRTGMAKALGNHGLVDLEQGRYQQATRHVRQALNLFRQTGDRIGETHALGNLGRIDLLEGRYQDAASHYQQAVDLARDTGDGISEAYALNGLGSIGWREGRYQDAASDYQQALALFREIGVPYGEAEALNGLGQVFLAAGRPDDARAQHAAALSLAGQIDNKTEKARAHDGLGCSHDATGDSGQARCHWQQALTLYVELGAPEADDVRGRLAAMAHEGGAASATAPPAGDPS